MCHLRFSSIIHASDVSWCWTRKPLVNTHSCCLATVHRCKLWGMMAHKGAWCSKGIGWYFRFFNWWVSFARCLSRGEEGIEVGIQPARSPWFLEQMLTALTRCYLRAPRGGTLKCLPPHCVSQRNNNVKFRSSSKLCNIVYSGGLQIWKQIFAAV